MDIVRSVTKKVKFDYYILQAGDEGIVRAVRDIMDLFGIYPASKLNVDLEEGLLFIENKCLLSFGNLEVTSRIVFLCCGQIKRFDKINSSQCATDEFERLEKQLIKNNIMNLMIEITGVKPSPWGILRGVRPTKLVHKLLDNKVSREQIIRKLHLEYSIDLSKAELVTDIAIHQRPFLNCNSKMVSIYIGIPYCPSKCLYCSFPSYILPAREQVDLFMAALKAELEATRQIIEKYGLCVESVYIGGGTPTSLEIGSFKQLLTLVNDMFINKFTKEYTIEAGRPDSITDEKLNLIVQAGATRVSVNPQSMQKKTLKYIGRMHTVQDIIDVFQKMRQMGIPVINMDLIAGLPGETINDMVDTMRQIATLRPDNITVHTLALKKGSDLKTSNIRHDILPSEVITEEMLNISRKYLAEMNLKPYYLYRQKYMTGNFENIGYARTGTECLYNMQIMEERQTIIGHGPGASTKAVNVSTWQLNSCYNPKDVKTYISNNARYRNQKQALLMRLFEGESAC